MILRTSTYPNGQHRKLDDGDIVQRVEVISGQKRLRDCYVSELCVGDEYHIPEQFKQSSRNGDMILHWIEENMIDTALTFDVDGNPESIELSDRFGQVLCTYPYGEGCFREACEFVMDQEDRHEQCECRGNDSFA